jgi:uncharacterized protein
LCAIPLPIVDSGHASSAGSSLCLTCGMCCRGVLNPTALLDEDELDRAAALGVRTLKKDDGHDAFHLPCPHHEHEANACTIYEDRFHVCRRYECDLLSALSKDEIPLDEALRIARATRAIEERIYELIGGRNPSQVIWYQAVAFTEQSGIEDRVELARVHGEILVNLRMLSFLCNRHFEARLHKRLNVVPSGVGGS